MEPLGVYVLVGVAAIVIKGVLSYKRSRDDKTRRAFRRPIVPIASVRNGAVVVVGGRVQARGSVHSWLSRKPCALFEHVQTYQTGSVWHEHSRHIGGVEFALRDDTGEALVYGEDAEVLLNKDLRVPQGDGIWEQREGMIENGDRVVVAGHATWEPDPRPESAGLGYRERPTILVIRKTRRTPLRVTNSPAIVGRLN